MEVSTPPMCGDRWFFPMTPPDSDVTDMNHPRSQDVLSTREVARLLRVSEATIKRWADDGLLSCFKTPGGHRKFRLEDINVFRSSRGFVQSSDPLADGTAGVDELMRLALSGDGIALANTLIAALGRGEPLEKLCDEWLLPMMVEVGARWECGALSVAQEHIVSQTVIDSLSQVAVVVQADPKRGIALTGCLEGERHDIGSRMASLILRKHGYRVLQLGADTPVADVMNLAERENVTLIALSGAGDVAVPYVTRAIDRLADWARRTLVRVIVGGSGYHRLPIIPSPIERLPSMHEFSRLVAEVTPTLL